MSSEEDRLDARAEFLVRSDRELLTELVRHREKHNLEVEEVAERMGVSEDTVRDLERYDANPRLSTLRLYAMAVEVRVAHVVEDDCVGESIGNQIESIYSDYMPSETMPDLGIALLTAGRTGGVFMRRTGEYKSWSAPKNWAWAMHSHESHKGTAPVG